MATPPNSPNSALEVYLQDAAKSRELAAQREKRAVERERETEALRAALHSERAEMERQMQRQLAEREEYFSNREKSLIDRQKEFEAQLAEQQTKSSALRTFLSNEIASREAKLQQSQVELQQSQVELQQAQTELRQEKERYSEETRKRIERTSQGYVAEALDLLDKKERQFHRLSKIWAFAGATSLTSGLAYFIYLTIDTVTSLPSEITWEFITFAALRGLLAVGLLFALARYAFLYSTSYMREALKNADRTHAINFGKFYLQSYGAAADWSQVREAFANWNTTGSNAFASTTGAEFDFPAMEKAAAILEKLSKSLPKPVDAKP